MPIKYNFWSSLLSVFIGWLPIPLVPLITSFCFWLLGGGRDALISGFILIIMSSVFSLPICFVSLLLVPLIVGSFNYFFKQRNLFPLWTTLCALLCFEPFIWPGGLSVFHLLVSICGFISGIAYLQFDKKFFSKEEIQICTK